MHVSSFSLLNFPEISCKKFSTGENTRESTWGCGLRSIRDVELGVCSAFRHQIMSRSAANLLHWSRSSVAVRMTTGPGARTVAGLTQNLRHPMTPPPTDWGCRMSRHSMISYHAETIPIKVLNLYGSDGTTRQNYSKMAQKSHGRHVARISAVAATGTHYVMRNKC